jgi:hypothetical protein
LVLDLLVKLAQAIGGGGFEFCVLKGLVEGGLVGDFGILEVAFFRQPVAVLDFGKRYVVMLLGRLGGGHARSTIDSTIGSMILFFVWGGGRVLDRLGAQGPLYGSI